MGTARSRSLPSRLTPGDIAELVLDRNGPSLLIKVDILLTCGVTMPHLSLEIYTDRDLTSLKVGDETTGSITLGVYNDENGRLSNVDLESFFYDDRMTPAYREVLNTLTDISPPHVFMLLLDEVMLALLQRDGPRRGDRPFELRLEDAADLGYSQPNVLSGHHLVRPRLSSRFLQWKRGVGYYATFGFWPVGITPVEYLESAAALHNPGNVTLASGEPGYNAATRHLDMFDDHVKWVKQYPPVLPPVTVDGPLRRYRDNAAYAHDIVNTGRYGKASGWTRPHTKQQPVANNYVQNWPQGPIEELLEAIAVGRPWSANGPFKMEGVPVGKEVSIDFDQDTGYIITMQPWWITVTHNNVNIDGPFERKMIGLVDRLGVGNLPMTWVEPLSKGSTGVIIEGRKHHVDRLMLTDNVRQLVSSGFVPESMTDHPARIGRLLDEAKWCDERTQGEILTPTNALFAPCRDIAERLAEELWVRAPPRPRDKHARKRQ